METIKSFLSQVVAKDEQMKAKINTATPAEIIKMAADAGYNFTEEALVNFFNALNTTVSRELSDADLEAVAGGQKCNITAAYSKSKTSGNTVCCGDM